MPAQNILYPDKKCYASAQCQAYSAGIRGYTGHERKGKDCTAKMYFNAECSDYGHLDPLDIVMALLIDKGIPSLDHRVICFYPYNKVGVSIQPHKQWTYNTVVDFHL